MKLFKQIKVNHPQLNAFDLSHERKFTMEFGKLVPIMCEEVVPGDVFKLNSEAFIRFSPLVAPVMHRIDVFTHFFFVPNRIVWKDWETFITGAKNGRKLNEEELRIIPNFTLTNLNALTVVAGDDTMVGQLFGPDNLGNYLGTGTIANIPIEGEDIQLNALPFLAYQRIWLDYYRDQNLQNDPESIVRLEEVMEQICEGVGGDISESMIDGTALMRKRNWEKDYFTSSLPWPQKGDEVNIPLSGELFVEQSSISASKDVRWVDATGTPLVGDVITGADGITTINGTTAYLNPNYTLSIDGVRDDTDEVSGGININDLRYATKLQQWMETAARAGSRYIETILAHFGVKVPDSRLDRPEYLGGGKSPVVVSETLQTSETSETSPQGNMAGHAISVGRTHGFKARFEEHGYVIGLISVMPRSSYQQGIRKMFLKRDQFDFYWPEFANLGEQEVKNIELFNDPSDGENNDVFGYQSRYSEYKFIPSTVHGQFTDELSLGTWHMGRIFDSRPELNGEFVECDATTRIFAVEGAEDYLFCQVYNDLKALRPMPFFGTPQL